jgi:DNA-binding transcriptional MerR regulator
MGELSRRSGIAASTIKHYLREGLLPAAAVSTARNSALYDPALVARLVEIKELQTTHFLPLWRIKEVLAGTADPRVATVSAAVDRVTAEDAQRRATRASLLSQGMAPAELDALIKARLLPDDDVFVGDDLALAETIVRAHNAGLTDHLSTVEILARYVDNVSRLVEDEIAIFRDTILSGAGTRLAASTVEAMRVSERLVLLLRRRLLLPTFERTMAGAGALTPAPTTGADAMLIRSARARRG